MTEFKLGTRGNLVTDRDSLHASDGYAQQVAALQELKDGKNMTDKTMTLEPCKECGSNETSWSCAPINNGQAVDGRVCMREVSMQFYRGCDSCSETLEVIGADEFLAKLNRHLSQPAERGLCERNPAPDAAAACVPSYATTVWPSGSDKPAERARVPDGLKLAISHIQKKADDYAEENCGVEWDTGATTYKYGKAGEDYHHSLLELVDELTALSAAPESSIDVAEDQQWTKDQAKIHERKTVHEWLNELHIEQFEFGKPICLLRRLRILCDKYFEACEQLSFEIRKQVGLVNVEEGDPRCWIDISVSRPKRNKPAIYWHKSEHGGFLAIADAWRDEHHLAHASHWMPYVKPIGDAK